MCNRIFPDMGHEERNVNYKQLKKWLKKTSLNLKQSRYSSHVLSMFGYQTGIIQQVLAAQVDNISV